MQSLFGAVVCIGSTSSWPTLTSSPGIEKRIRPQPPRNVPLLQRASARAVSGTYRDVRRRALQAKHHRLQQRARHPRCRFCLCAPGRHRALVRRAQVVRSRPRQRRALRVSEHHRVRRLLVISEYMALLRSHPDNLVCARYCECKDPSYFWYSKSSILHMHTCVHRVSLDAAYADTGHPTEHVHRLLAQAIEAELLQASR